MKKLTELKFNHLSGVIRCVLSGLATTLVLFALILTGITPDQYEIYVGHPASKTIYATQDVEDVVTTQALRDAAANAVEPSYKNVDPSVNAVVLSDVAAFTFEQLRRPVSREDLLSLILAEYDVDAETATADLDALLAQFREMNLLED